MRKPIHSRGFTLLELLVGAAVGALVLVGISLTFISQARQYQAHAGRRALQANARQAMTFMERRLRDAGYGVNADRAIIPYDSFNAATNASEAGYPDAFIVHWRDTRFRADAISATPVEIRLTAPLTTELRMGTILLVICSPVTTPSGNEINDRIVNAKPPHAFVTVGQHVAIGQSTIPLEQTDPTAAPNSPLAMPGRLFHEQAAELTNPCFTGATPPSVVMINRAAFYVAMFTDFQGVRTPYLMMHSGQDLPSGNNAAGDGVIDAADAVPVAAGIEQLQVSYVLDTNTEDNPAAAPPGDFTPIVRGVENDMDAAHYGEAWEGISTPTFGVLPRNWFLNPFTTWPNTLYDPTTGDLLRRQLADHPANIRQVRLTLISRNTLPDPQIRGDDLLLRQNGTAYPDGPPLPGANGRSWRHLENLGAPAADFRPAGGGFYRFILRQSVTPKNMTVNRQFVPVNPLGGG
ncbi:MAG TPA: prepilin-type N-terminal cleavage/methylation domain-containing protein [Hyalangium sp.]|nr:prepilin-type N-terminal cleavage/methylation domain-containing protein [Hyalangium sp.]